MKTIKGKYANAIVYTDNIEDTAHDQILEFCNQSFTRGVKIRIMPDVHAGKGCVIGFTANLVDVVVPNLVGVDIGCGMLTVKLGNVDIDMQTLDSTIRDYVPSGSSVHEGRKVKFSELKNLHCFRNLKDTKRIERSIGTLGGGNHFIEVGVDKGNDKYLIIHSGSRNLGKQVAEFYQNIAIDMHSGKEDYYKERDRIIATYRNTDRKHEIQGMLKGLKGKYDDIGSSIPKHLCYLTGEYRDKYLHDMNICQQYANLNRVTIASIIVNHLFNKNLVDFEHFQTVHNYINMDDNIVRKGAVSAQDGKLVLIPINMRDGSILARGKGNKDWNCSVAHGAGRLMSRTKAKEVITLGEFQDSMDGIWTTSVTEETIDESPMSYKPIDEILNNIGESVEIIDIIKPIYNYKAN